MVSKFVDASSAPDYDKILNHYRESTPDVVRGFCEGLAKLPLEQALLILAYQIAHLTHSVREMHADIYEVSDSDEKPN